MEVYHFPGGPMVKSSPSNAAGLGLIPDQGAEMPQTSWPKTQNIKKKKKGSNIVTSLIKTKKKVQAVKNLVGAELGLV